MVVRKARVRLISTAAINLKIGIEAVYLNGQLF